RWVPTIRFLNDYHADELYIRALAKSVQTYWAKHGRGNHLLISFHGTPKTSLLRGDPYHCQCQATARLLAEHLQVSESDWSIGFQSRFGWNEWLQPYTTTRLQKLGSEGLKQVDVVCPGFAVDCLETLEEIELQYNKEFIKSGGGSLRYIPALNDSPDHIDMLTSLTLRNIAGWNEAEPNWDSSLDKSKREAVKIRADRMKNHL
ncbi:MAG TPA: ferrochelatase, partial [Gammaproteobacteria bacterium]|nr:ferrochelatase [Gammaproteobacteria bacterium]